MTQSRLRHCLVLIVVAGGAVGALSMWSQGHPAAALIVAALTGCLLVCPRQS